MLQSLYLSWRWTCSNRFFSGTPALWAQDATEAFLSVGHSQERFGWSTPLRNGWFNGFNGWFNGLMGDLPMDFPLPSSSSGYIGYGLPHFDTPLWGNDKTLVDADKKVWRMIKARDFVGGFRYSMRVRAACCFPLPRTNGLHGLMQELQHGSYPYFPHIFHIFSMWDDEVETTKDMTTSMNFWEEAWALLSRFPVATGGGTRAASNSRHGCFNPHSRSSISSMTTGWFVVPLWLWTPPHSS